MSKKLLNEAAVRRFMGLAGMEANMVSNAVNEMYGDKPEGEHKDKEEGYEMEEAMHGDKEEGMHGDKKEGEHMEEMDDAMEGEHEDPVADADALADVEDEMMGEEVPELEITPEMRDVFIEFGDMLKAKRDAGDMDDEEEMEMADDMEVEDEEDMEDAEAMMETTEETVTEETELTEDEIVQEVARRVAARILKAKNAQKEMNEALGK